MECKIILDSKAAKCIREASQEDYVDPVRFLLNEMDIEYEIIRMENELPEVKINYESIKGHRDVQKAKNPKYTKLNVTVDDLATISRDEVNTVVRAAECLKMFSGAVATLFIGTEIIHNNLKEEVGLIMNEEKTKQDKTKH